MLKTATLLLVTCLCTTARAEMEFKIVTADGFVAFTAGNNWPVFSMQTKLPMTTAVFQIPNPADEGTPDSTNLFVRFYDLGSPAARESFEKVGAPIEGAAPKVESIDGWKVYRQVGKQGTTEYSIIDAKRELRGLSASVRLAWPHLATNPPDYAAQMDWLFAAMLRSIHQHVGPYEPRDGETVKRPSP